VSVYVPVGWVTAALAAYQTVVVSFAAVVDVLFRSIGEPLAGMPAHLLVLDVLLFSTE